MHSSRQTLPLFATLISVGAMLHAQPASPAKEFEVASIKPGDPAARGTRIQIMPGGRFIASGMTVKMLIGQAYDVKEFQISGGPGWLNSDRFDINAKADGATSQDAMRPMLQALLADRFKLGIHRETKELPAYSLVAGKNGPKLAASTSVKKGMMRMSRGTLNAEGVTVAGLAGHLSSQLSRPVIDDTGLKGEYDIKLTWTPDQSEGAGHFGPSSEAAPVLDSTGPSLFTALQEQLGLKLEPKKSAVEIIVVDKIEKPAEN